ncbi:putative drug exporter of the RND superfamily [Brevibacterium sandarakinum]|uniref:Drug exporter of the RND superfamily n=1 Tax=Brevibacterium sandarakinum TaxID=629680 RepID=A0A1H1UTH8_BRESA|nr:efflux RND transporter permease subunit [Brevibacterium sandarakinum]SDS75888.1 putative drug exporter of the RND superfamily [Brevibacterium sandarakinum]
MKEKLESSRLPRRIVRILVPAVLILLWLAVFGFGGMSFGSIDEVATDERSSFLPSSAESTKVQNEITEFTGSDAVPAIIVAERQGGLTDADQAGLERLAERAADVIQGAESSPVISSDDKEAAQLVVSIPADAEIGDVVTQLEEDAGQELSGLDFWVSGPAGFSADLQEAFSGIDGILLLVALAVVFVILVIVYRSPLLPVLVLVSSLTALCAAVLINVALAREGVVTLNGQVQGILFILVIGAATDYSLLYIARCREELRDTFTPSLAAWKAMRGVFEPILASGGTVIVGLLCLLLSDLGSNSALGPVAAVGIACAMLTTLTFLPAMLAVFGRASFWPRGPKYGTEHPVLTGPGATGFWPGVGRFVARGPRRLVAGVTLVLVVGCAGLVFLDANGVAQSEFVLGDSQARDGQAVIDDHFAGGAGNPAYVLAPSDERREVAEEISSADGIDDVSLVAQDSPSGTTPIDDTGKAITDSRPGPPPAEPTEINGDIMFSLTLSAPADSLEAEGTIEDLREHLSPTQALVGGSTAVDLDTNETSSRDRTVIIPIVLIVITIMLALLLRSLVAPVLLLATTVLSFGTALGVSAVIFRLIGQPQSDPSVPLYAFVFLVALGIDYNIFLMTRVREETITYRTREGTLRGLSVTGGVITSAGIVLAATFAALLVIPIQFLLQLAIIVSLGVLLDALIVRTLLVPALSLWIGDRLWWPSRLAKPSKH